MSENGSDNRGREAGHGQAIGAEALEGTPPITLPEPADAVAEVVSAAADELRGPAAVLIRNVRQLHRALPGTLPEGARRALASLERQATRIGGVAAALLDVQRIERGRMQLRRRPLDLADLLERVVDARRPLARQRGIELSVAIPPAPVPFPGDEERLRQAIGALVDGAISLTRRRDAVHVALETTPAGLQVRVAVPGTGRPRSSARRGSTPLAMGLARRLAELHGGSLEVIRGGDALEERLVLPLAVPPVARQVERSARARAHLLVVDDDPDARDALALMLGDDYEVLLAGDGQEAVERATADRPDVILMDLYMPRLDGLAALEALRADRATEDVPVILISARGDELTRVRSLDLGAVDFLQKPFSARELKARIERTLRLTRREIELQELARTDPLTGLANLRAFRGRLDDEVKRARRYHTPLACVMVDMDNLKPINDELGHTAGDFAIRALADVIRRELRATDFGARYGGDEFVLLLPHTSGQEARVFAERVLERLRASPLELRGRRLPLSASMGIGALGDELLDDAGEMLVRRADAALYAAKRGGRGRVEAFAGGDAAVT